MEYRATLRHNKSSSNNICLFPCSTRATGRCFDSTTAIEIRPRLCLSFRSESVSPCTPFAHDRNNVSKEAAGKVKKKTIKGKVKSVCFSKCSAKKGAPRLNQQKTHSILKQHAKLLTNSDGLAAYHADWQPLNE